MADELPPVVRDLAAAVSASVEVQNRYWLALAVASLFAVVPETRGPEPGHVALPFGLPTVDASWFALLMVLLLSGLSVAFATAQAHTIRAGQLAYRVIERLPREERLVAGEDLRDLYKSMTRPSLDQVSSLANVLRGERAFLVESDLSHDWGRKAALVYYTVLKIVVIFLWLALPATALYLSVVRFAGSEHPAALSSFTPWIVWPSVACAALALAAALVLEFAYFTRVLRRLWGAPRTAGGAPEGVGLEVTRSGQRRHR